MSRIGCSPPSRVSWGWGRGEESPSWTYCLYFSLCIRGYNYFSLLQAQTAVTCSVFHPLLPPLHGCVAVTFAVCMSLPPLSINFLFFFLVIVLIQLFWSLASLIWIFGCWNQEDICPKKPFIFQLSSFPLTPKEVSQEVKSVNSFSYPSWGLGFCWASIPEDHEFYQGMIAITQATSHLDLFSSSVPVNNRPCLAPPLAVCCLD